MKSIRSPLAVATAALMAAPPATAQPMQLTPAAPAVQQQQQEEAPREIATATPAAQPQPAASNPAAAPTSAPAAAPPPELRGPIGPTPADLSVTAPVLPPAAPPAPPPRPRATPAPTPARAAPPPAPPPPPPPARMASTPEGTVTVGARDDFTRLSFRFPSATTVTPLQQGSRLELRFSRAADLDMAELIALPPRFVREVRRLNAAGAPLRLLLTLDPGVRQRHFVDGDRIVVDLLPPLEGGEMARTAPVTGAARVQLVEHAADTTITVAWPAPVAAAAFRRGEAIWLLFDAAGRIDLANIARVGRRHSDIEVVRGEGVVGLRIPAPPEVQVSAAAQDETWTFTLGARAQPSEAVTLDRMIGSDGRGVLAAHFGRNGVVRWIADPEIGDRLAVALLPAPVRGVNVRRATIEASILPSAQGAVVETRADGVVAEFSGGDLVVSRGVGLIAAPTPDAAQQALAAGLAETELGDRVDQPAREAGLTLVQVRARIDDLSRRAAREGVAEGAPVEARMALARFLVQQELAEEALGALRVVAINQGELVEIDPEYRLLRAAANVMSGHINAAQADLSASALADNASASLWRGYAAAQRREWDVARRELERGRPALEQHPPGWRSRFQLALAESALELNDLAAAESAIRSALGQAPEQTIRLHARYLDARLTAARGDNTRALAMLDELSSTRDEAVAVRANVEAIRLRRASGMMRAIDAIEPLEALRFRWRGDEVEIAVVAMLGDAYSELGRWREALSTMRVAASRYPANAAARQLRADMTTLFERLFLDGEADRLEPIQALGLFYEFAELTPVGPNGDRIVRLLAGRLVHVDLLEQAAQLLQHQVDERLEGVGKAQVAADLAAIYLMDRKPDRALTALANSRQPNMSPTLLADRRILEARALLELGRLDGAVELVERDRSEEAQRVRAEAAWRARDWRRAGAELRTLLGARNRAQPLSEDERQSVLRLGIALTLGGDEAGVGALYREYAGDMANTDDALPFEVIAAGVQTDGAQLRDVARAVARTDLLDQFMQRMRARMTAEAAQSAAASEPGGQAPGAPAPAAPPPQAALPAQPGQQTRPTPRAGA